MTKENYQHTAILEQKCYLSASTNKREEFVITDQSEAEKLMFRSPLILVKLHYEQVFHTHQVYLEHKKDIFTTKDHLMGKTFEFCCETWN